MGNIANPVQAQRSLTLDFQEALSVFQTTQWEIESDQAQLVQLRKTLSATQAKIDAVSANIVARQTELSAAKRLVQTQLDRVTG